jgi:hypothetical protein
MSLRQWHRRTIEAAMSRRLRRHAPTRVSVARAKLGWRYVRTRVGEWHRVARATRATEAWRSGRKDVTHDAEGHHRAPPRHSRGPAHSGKLLDEAREGCKTPDDRRGHEGSALAYAKGAGNEACLIHYRRWRPPDRHRQSWVTFGDGCLGEIRTASRVGSMPQPYSR